MKNLVLLGVFDADVKGSYRLPNNLDIEAGKVILTFIDPANPTVESDLPFSLTGDYGLTPLVKAVSRHMKTISEWPLDSKYNRKPNSKDRNVTFHDSLATEKEPGELSSNQVAKPLNEDHKKVIEFNEDKVDFLSDVAQISIQNADWFEDEGLITVLGRVLALMPALEAIEVPVGSAHALCTSNWVNIWGREIKLKEINHSGEIEEEIVLGKIASPKVVSNGNEIQSPVPTGSATRERDTKPYDTEERIWTNEEDYRLAVLGLGTLAMASIVAHRSGNTTVTPDQLFRAVSLFGGAQRRVMRIASFVPFVPTFLRIAGSVANHTVVPVAHALGIVKK